MIKHIAFNALGKADYGWLKANHHFSFAHYYNPSRMGFGTVRVINDDWVAAGMGFDPHPHRNMEIITFVRSGEITHKDNAGNEGTTQAGEVQVMSAGSGIIHSEYNHSSSPLTLYQIWIETNQNNVTPRWDSQLFPTDFITDNLQLLVSGDTANQDKTPPDKSVKNTPLFIYQNAKIWGGKLQKGTVINHNIEHQAYILASDGEFVVNSADNADSAVLKKGDGAEVTAVKSINLTAVTDCELVLIDAP